MPACAYRYATRPEQSKPVFGDSPPQRYGHAEVAERGRGDADVGGRRRIGCRDRVGRQHGRRRVDRRCERSRRRGRRRSLCRDCCRGRRRGRGRGRGLRRRRRLRAGVGLRAGGGSGLALEPCLPFGSGALRALEPGLRGGPAGGLLACLACLDRCDLRLHRLQQLAPMHEHRPDRPARAVEPRHRLPVARLLVPDARRGEHEVLLREARAVGHLLVDRHHGVHEVDLVERVAEAARAEHHLDLARPALLVDLDEARGATLVGDPVRDTRLAERDAVGGEPLGRGGEHDPRVVPVLDAAVEARVECVDLAEDRLSLGLLRDEVGGRGCARAGRGDRAGEAEHTGENQRDCHPDDESNPHRSAAGRSIRAGRTRF